MVKRKLTKYKEDSINPLLSAAQRKKSCTIVGCNNTGRTIGHLGGIELNYCGHHRKYGERVLNFFVRAVFGEKLREFLKDSKDDLFMKNSPHFCEDCNKRVVDYVNENIKKLDEINQWNDKKNYKSN